MRAVMSDVMTKATHKITHKMLLTLLLATALRAAEITVSPTSQITLLGEHPQFFCEADGGTPRWVINQVPYNSNIHRDRGIVRSAFQALGSVQQTTLEVHATAENNNTELRCRVSEQVQSAPVFLQIQALDLVSLNHFTCETLCDDSLLVTWMINGMFLSQLANQLSVRTETDYPLQCDSGSQGSATYTSTLQVLSDTDMPLPVPYTVQCIAVATCNRGDETTPCIPQICYSNRIIRAEGTEDTVSQLVLLTTATDFPTYSITTSPIEDALQTENATQTQTENTTQTQTENTILVMVSSAAGILLITCVCLLLCSSVVCCKMVARGKTATANSTELPTMKIEEVIYEECGDAAHVTQARHHVTQAPPSPPPPVLPPTLQLCQAYEPSGQPKTDLNIAYATSGQPQTDRNIAYAIATAGQPQT